MHILGFNTSKILTVDFQKNPETVSTILELEAVEGKLESYCEKKTLRFASISIKPDKRSSRAAGEGAANPRLTLLPAIDFTLFPITNRVRILDCVDIQPQTTSAGKVSKALFDEGRF